MCDGSEVDRVVYANLFAEIGTLNGGGDGVTTFNLPDYRGRFLRGVDGGAGRDPDAASRTEMNPGGATGDDVGSVHEDMFMNHTHPIPHGMSRDQGGSVPGGNLATTSATISAEESPTGGAETRPKNANVNWIIKY
jgi:microcystin-dependent protein